MKQKKLVFFPFLLVLALLFTSCSFESSESGLESWAESKGIPSYYKVETVTISDLKASSAVGYSDTVPTSADAKFVIGNASNLTHELLMDVAFTVDTNFIATMKSSDSTGAFLLFAFLSTFYEADQFPSDSLNVEEDLDVEFLWKIATSDRKKFVDSISDISDSMWYATAHDWEDASSADTSFTISLAELDSSVRIDLPTALVEDLKNLKRYARVQVRVNLKNASRIYRFYGEDTNYPPYLSMWYTPESDSTVYQTIVPSRMASLVTNNEDCTDCPILHGGVYDSIVVEIPPEKILNALSEFYGEEYPVSEEEEYDTRQYVLLAQLTMARDDSKGSNELGLPIQIVVGSYIDSGDTQIRKMESYRLNDELILEEGHPNMVFYEGDSLSLQITYGVRDFVNRAADGRSLKFMVRMGYPVLQDKDTTYSDYVNDDGDSVKVFFTQFDYARYDLSTILDPMTLKIWLASKKETDEDDN